MGKVTILILTNDREGIITLCRNTIGHTRHCMAVGYVLEKDKDAKDNYYVDDIFISQTGQSLGLMWGNERSI